MAERNGRRSSDARPRWTRDGRQRHQNSDTQHSRVEFYTVYDREAKSFDEKYVEACQTNLSDVSLFAGLVSAISSYLASQASTYAGRDPSTESADILRAILFTLNSSLIPDGEEIYVPPLWDEPTRQARFASNLLYASFLLTILASFLATVAKQWLDNYVRHSETSMTARCWERQRKRDGLDRWFFQAFIDGLPLLLQVSLVLLVAGLISYLGAFTPINAEVVVIFTALGAGIYVLFTIPGTFSRESPLRTSSSVVMGTFFGNIFLFSPALRRWFISTRKKLSRLAQLSKISRLLPLSMQDIDSYLGITRTANAHDAHCVSWFLRNIADPEAMDAALQLSATVQWFEDGCNLTPPYDSIVSIFESRFDFAGSPDKELGRRASSSGAAIFQVRISALLQESEERASMYPIPKVRIDASKIDDDLKSVLRMLESIDGEHFPPSLPLNDNPNYPLWTAELLLWFVLKKRSNITECYSLVCERDLLHYPQWHKFPPKAINNFLLVWCIHLGWEADRKVLTTQSHSTEGLLERLSTLVMGAISPSGPHLQSLVCLLNGLAEWAERPLSLAPMALAWCTAICKGIEDDDQCASLLYPALRVGYYRFTPDNTQIADHQTMVNLVFRHRGCETVAGALCAWTSPENHDHRDTLLDPCVRHLVELAHTDVEFPPKLGRVITRAITLVDFVERVGVERFVGLLARLEVGIDDINNAEDSWASLILRVIASGIGRKKLPLRYWELLVKLVGGFSGELRSVLRDEEVTRSLEAEEEWQKLGCWLDATRAMQPLGEDETQVEDDVEKSLSHPVFSSTGLPADLQAPETAPSPAPSPIPFQSAPGPPPAPSFDPSQVPDLPSDPSPVQSPFPLSDETSLPGTQEMSESSVRSRSPSPPPSPGFGDDED